jgi:hypothetical protein
LRIPATPLLTLILGGKVPLRYPGDVLEQVAVADDMVLEPAGGEGCLDQWREVRVQRGVDGHRVGAKHELLGPEPLGYGRNAPHRSVVDLAQSSAHQLDVRFKILGASAPISLLASKNLGEFQLLIINYTQIKHKTDQFTLSHINTPSFTIIRSST